MNWIEALRDPRVPGRRHVVTLLNIVFVLWALAVIVRGEWSMRLEQFLFQAWVIAWLMAVTSRTRTISLRDVARFWTLGFLPVMLGAVVMTDWTESLYGSGNFQLAVVVPIIEEIAKALPLILWVVLSSRRQVRPTVSDLVVLAFAVGAGFSFHEDALWQRLAADGFSGSPSGVLFPTYLHENALVVTHGGWSLIAGFGIGLWAVHRERAAMFLAVVATVAVAALDHGAANARGALEASLSSVMLDGRLAAGLVVVSIAVALIHDVRLLRWAEARDRRFTHPSMGDELHALVSQRPPASIANYLALRRYRRARNAAFVDLYAARARGRSSGDRSEIVAWLRSLEPGADLPSMRAQTAQTP